MKIKTSLILITLILSQASYLKAQEQWIFFYPGTQGNAEEAAPLMEAFSQDLQQASDGKIQFQASYENQGKEGLTKILHKKPSLVLVAGDWYESQSSLQVFPLLAQAKLLGDSPNQETFYFLCKKPLKSQTQKIKVYTQKDFAPGFLEKKLEPLGLNLEVSLVEHPLATLKKIAASDNPEYFLADEVTYQNLKNLKAPWLQQLSTQDPTLKIPAPKLLALQTLPDKKIKQINKALEKISKSSQAQESLNLLRLQGFEINPQK
ncbi:MAG: hypothetical protein KDK66_05995 [Deltaproteobacteria bacterium]|nr:hypothetical protein [Deltaproteobacteria bacterium]